MYVVGRLRKHTTNVSQVLSAFFASATVTCLVIVMGYLSNSLPLAAEHNEVDDNISAIYQNSFFHTKIVTPVACGFTALVSRLISFARRSKAPKPARKPFTREQRAAALARFILALSDQQLVTGLAILIGAIANWCRITLYEFQMATCLAWFSMTTHLLTLDILKGYFIRHRTLRHWRVVGVVLNLLLLIFAVIVLNISWLENRGAAALVNPVQCVFNFAGGLATRNDQSYLIGLAMDGFVIVLNLVLTFWVVLPAYYWRIYVLYREDTFAALRQEAILIAHSPAYLRLSNSAVTPTSNINMAARVTPRTSLHDFWVHRRIRNLQDCHPTRRRLSQIIACVERETYESHPEHWVPEKKEPSRFMRFKRRWLPNFPNRYILRYDSAYLSKFPVMIFLFVRGLVDIVLLRWYADMKLAEATRRMDFGQVTAVFLLVLPVLTGLEVLSGESHLLVRIEILTIVETSNPDGDSNFNSFSPLSVVAATAGMGNNSTEEYTSAYIASQNASVQTIASDSTGSTWRTANENIEQEIAAGPSQRSQHLNVSGQSMTLNNIASRPYTSTPSIRFTSPVTIVPPTLPDARQYPKVCTATRFLLFDSLHSIIVGVLSPLPIWFVTIALLGWYFMYYALITLICWNITAEDACWYEKRMSGIARLLEHTEDLDSKLSDTSRRSSLDTALSSRTPSQRSAIGEQPEENLVVSIVRQDTEADIGITTPQSQHGEE